MTWNKLTQDVDGLTLAQIVTRRTPFNRRWRATGWVAEIAGRSAVDALSDESIRSSWKRLQAQAQTIHVVSAPG